MRFNKGTYKFSKKELWNLKNSLGDIIADGIDQFKTSNLHGYPINLAKTTKEHPNGTVPSDEAFAEWMVILDKISFAFRNHDKDFYDFNKDEIFMQDLQLVDSDKNGFKTVLFKPLPGYTQDDIDEQSKRQDLFDKEHNDKVKEGIELFTLYFRDLWD